MGAVQEVFDMLKSLGPITILAGLLASSRAYSPAEGQCASWQPLGVGISDFVGTLAVYNGELIAGGGFVNAGGIPVNHIARWNGSTWQPLGSGLGEEGDSVEALTTYNGELIAGGFVTTAGGSQ